VVFLTESVFKSAALHQLGWDSWSVNGSDVQDKLYHQLTLLPYRFVGVGDDDAAGEKLAGLFKQGAVMDDLDERSPQELRDLLERFL